MEPSDLDDLAKGLHALFTISNRWDAALPATQELYRKGVRYVLEHAKPPRAADQESLERDLAAAKKACDEWGIRAGQLEKERDAFKAHNALLTQDIEGWKRHNELLRKDCDEQKARADEQEALASRELRNNMTLTEGLVKLTSDWNAREYDYKERIAALEKACSMSAAMLEESSLRDSAAAEEAIRILRAALDAPQPKDSEPVSAGSSHLVAPEVENTGQSTRFDPFAPIDQLPADVRRDIETERAHTNAAHAIEAIRTSFAQEEQRNRALMGLSDDRYIDVLRADLTEIANILLPGYAPGSWNANKLRAIIQRGQARTQVDGHQSAKLEREDRERRDAAFDDVIKASDKKARGE